MAVRIQFRRGTASEWTSANPTLAVGELGYETDNEQFKIGDGTTDWANLSYAAVSASYVDDAIANVVGLAPEALDTLNELAQSIGDDPDFVSTVADNLSNAISDHSNVTTNIHGIADTSELETQTGAQTKANNAQSNAASYTDNAIANLIDNSPDALNTLNELAAALGDDANFSTTVTNSLASKINFVIDTKTNFETANAVTTANTIYIESDQAGYVRIGDGSTNYNDLAFIGRSYIELMLGIHEDATTNVHGISDTAALVVDTDLSAHTDATTNVHGISDTANLVYASDLETHNSDTTNVHGISDTSNLVYQDDLTAHEVETTNVHGIADTADLLVTQDLTDHANTTSNVHGIADTADLVVTADLADYAPLDGPTFTTSAVLPANTVVGGVTADEISYLSGVTSGIQDQIANLLPSATAASTYAPIDGATLTGTVTLPTSTSIGNVSAVEIATLDNVSSNIQTQLDGKLASATAATTYAPLANATLTGNVTLPATTDIGTVTGTEISYLANTTSEIQGQIDTKLASADAANTYAPIDSPTFTTAATLPATTTIGNVSATEISYVEGVTSSIQTQLNAKAAIAGATFTGSVEVPDITVTGNLYVQGSTTTISTSDLKVRDNMIYLNQAGLFDLSGAVGDGTNVVYTTSSAHDFSAGDYVTVANTTPSSFDVNGSGVEILAVTANTFTVASTVTDTYVSGGTARGKSHANPDLGWAAGRYADNTYAHAGLFRDASDGVFKMFDGYVPEPDESVFINTSDNTFALAPLAVSEITAANVVATTGVVFPDNTIQTSAGVPSLTGFTEKTASYTLDTLDHQDNVVEMNNANAITFTIPTNAALAWPVGASMDIIQTNTGQVTIANAVGVELNYTPGNKLRTQWSSCTIMKRGTDSWIVYGDLTA